MNKAKIYLTYQYYQARQHISLAFVFIVLLIVIAWPTMLLLMFKFDNYIPNISIYILEHSAWLHKNTEVYSIVKMLYYLGIGFAFLVLTFGFFGVMIAIFVRYVSLDKISLTPEKKNQFKQLEKAERAKLEKTYIETQLGTTTIKSDKKTIHKI